MYHFFRENTVIKVIFILKNVLKIKKFLIPIYKVLIYYLNVFLNVINDSQIFKLL